MSNETQVQMIVENATAEEVVNLEDCCNLGDVTTADGKATFIGRSVTMCGGEFDGDSYVFTVKVAPEKGRMKEEGRCEPIENDATEPRLDKLIRRSRVYAPDS